MVPKSDETFIWQLNRQTYAPKFLPRQGFQLVTAEKQSSWPYSLLKCHWTMPFSRSLGQTFWSGRATAASAVSDAISWLPFLVSTGNQISCELTSSLSTPQVYWSNCVIDFALQMINPAYWTSWLINAELSSFQIFWAGILIGHSQELYSAVDRTMWAPVPM